MYKLLVAVVVSTALIQGCSTMSDKAQMDSKGVQSFVGNGSDGVGVMTGAGDCLRSAGLVSENLIVECQASAKTVETEKAVAPRQLARLSYDGTALFAFDSDELSLDGRRELNNLIVKLNGNRDIGSIAVVGHADSIGSSNYNQELSERRAAAVRKFLEVTLKNVRVVTSGLGESSPVADNSTATGRQRNRRVDVNINATGSNAVFN